MSKHKPFEMCDCPSPDPGRPYHCAAVEYPPLSTKDHNPSVGLIVDLNGIELASLDPIKQAARMAHLLTWIVSEAVHHAEVAHGTDQWWACSWCCIRVSQAAATYVAASLATLEPMTGPGSCPGPAPDERCPECVRPDDVT